MTKEPLPVFGGVDTHKDATWRRFRKRRATVEHVLAELRVWSVLAEPPVQGKWNRPVGESSCRFAQPEDRD
jgi:hypothetical protein